MNIAYNMDCMEAMREMPDNAFDLAVVDPPYGDGCSQNVNAERERAEAKHMRAGRASEGISTNTEDGISRKVLRTGGTWAAKFSKKLSRGTLPQNRTILKNCFASHVTR